MIASELAKKKFRDIFREALSSNLKSPNSPEDALKNALKDIKFTQNNLILFNRMQLTALLALEAEFLKFVSEQESTEDLKQYEDLYEKLFGPQSEFIKKYQEGVNAPEAHKASVLKYEDLDPFWDARINFDNKLEFIKEIKAIWKFKNHSIALPNADEETIRSFLANIDPRVMSYAIVLNADNFKIKYIKPSKVDILHECIEVAYVMCCTLIDLTKVIIPPAATAALAITYGATLPMTVGLAMCVLSMELAALNSSKLRDLIDPNRIRQGVNTYIDHSLQTETLTSNIAYFNTPMQNIDPFSLLWQLLTYISNSYQKHKTEYRGALGAEKCETLEKLLEIKYKASKNTISKIETELFSRHLTEIGIEIGLQT